MDAIGQRQAAAESEAEEPASAHTAAPSLEFSISCSRHFSQWLEQQNVSLAFSTYQTGELFLIGRQPQGQPAVFERRFNRCMGLWTDGQTLWLASKYQIWRLENALAGDQVDPEFDRLFVPRVGYTTGSGCSIREAAFSVSSIGLSLIGDYAVVGLSKPRRNGSFRGLALDENLAERQAAARCGLQVIDLRSGDAVHWLRIDGSIQELYDVVTMPGVRRPKALGFLTNEIDHHISFPADGILGECPP